MPGLPGVTTTSAVRTEDLGQGVLPASTEPTTTIFIPTTFATCHATSHRATAEAADWMIHELLRRGRTRPDRSRGGELFTAGPRHGDRHADLLLEEGEVGSASRSGSWTAFGDLGEVGLPTGELLVDRRDLVEDRLVIRQVFEPLTVELVGDAHLHRVERVEHVELGDADLRQRVEADRVPHHHRIEPAGPATPTGVGAVFAADLDDAFTERPLASGVADLDEESPAARWGTAPHRPG